MKRKEWVVLAVLIASVAALEVFGSGGDGGDTEHAPAAGALQEVPGRVKPTDPRRSNTDPLEAFRTVRLHVTGMT